MDGRGGGGPPGRSWKVWAREVASNSEGLQIWAMSYIPIQCWSQGKISVAQAPLCNQLPLSNLCFNSIFNFLTRTVILEHQMEICIWFCCCGVIHFRPFPWSNSPFCSNYAPTRKGFRLCLSEVLTHSCTNPTYFHEELPLFSLRFYCHYFMTLKVNRGVNRVWCQFVFL